MAFVLITEISFARLGKRIRTNPEYCVALRYRDKLSLDQVMRYCKDRRYSITDLQVTSAGETQETVYDAVISLRRRGGTDIAPLLEHIRGIPGISDVKEQSV